jgi:hypothetical protein
MSLGGKPGQMPRKKRNKRNTRISAIRQQYLEEHLLKVKKVLLGIGTPSKVEMQENGGALVVVNIPGLAKISRIVVESEPRRLGDYMNVSVDGDCIVFKIV